MPTDKQLQTLGELYFAAHVYAEAITRAPVPPPPVPPPPVPPPPVPPPPVPPPPVPPPSPPANILQLSMGAGGVTDWNGYFPFLDLIKNTSREWSGAPILDRNGWPSMIAPNAQHDLLVLYDLQLLRATGLKTGTYVMRVKGPCTVTPMSYTQGGVTNIRRTAGTVTFDMSSDCTSLIVRVTNLTGSPAPVEFDLVHVNHIAARDGGRVMNPDWVNIYKRMPTLGFLRFMDLMSTNNSKIADIADVTPETHQSWTRDGYGIPPSVIGKAMKETGLKAAWINIPHRATMGVMRYIFAQIKSGDPTGSWGVFAEYSNECWNFQFQHFGYLANTKSAGLTIVDDKGNPYTQTTPNGRHAGCAYALGSMQVWTAAEETFGRKRVSRVAGGHPAWHDLMASWVMYKNPEYYGGMVAGMAADFVATTMYWSIDTVDNMVNVHRAQGQTDQWWRDETRKAIAGVVTGLQDTMRRYRVQGVTAPYVMYEGGDHHSNFDEAIRAKNPTGYDAFAERLFQIYNGTLGAEIFEMAYEATRQIGCWNFAKFVDMHPWKKPGHHQLIPFGAGRQTLSEPDSPIWTAFRNIL
jgi:hypothetical protein